MIGMEPVLLPRVVTEHDIGLRDGGTISQTCRRIVGVGRQLAVDRAEEVHGVGTEGVGRGALLRLAGGDQRRGVGRRDPTCPSSRR